MYFKRKNKYSVTIKICHLAAVREEGSEQSGGFFFADGGVEVRRMMAGGLVEDAGAMLDTAALGIGGAKIEPADAEQGYGLSAHGAGLKGDVEVAAGKPGIAQVGGGGPKRQHLGVGRGIVALFRPVAGGGQHHALAHYHGAHRDLAAIGGGPRFIEGTDHWR